MSNSNNYCVIMAGGIGSRFWPFSKSSLPKQFLDFFGTGQSLLQLTFERYKNIIPAENIIVTTNIKYKEIVQEQLKDIKESQIITETARRDTAPAIAQASYHIQKINQDANVIVAPIDHLIMNENEFFKCIKDGIDFVSDKDVILTLGIKPTRPETGYGYIQINDITDDKFIKVKTFVEKPQIEFAKVFVESQEFYWNSGIFIWNNKTIIKSFEELMPEICMKLKDKNEDFASCPNISIDYGIMEKANNVYVELCKFGWADLGSWNSLYEISPKDKEKNVCVNGNSLLYNCKDNLIAVSDNKLTIVQDLEGYLVASSDDVILVCKKDDEQSIRRFVNDVKIKLGDKYI